MQRIAEFVFQKLSGNHIHTIVNLDDFLRAGFASALDPDWLNEAKYLQKYWKIWFYKMFFL